VTYEYLFNHIKKEYKRGNDIAESLRMGKLVDTTKWEPELEISQATDEDEKKIEDKKNDAKYSKLMDVYIKRLELFEDNLISIYGLLWERCSKNLQNKIMECQDFENDIYSDPIKLMHAIKEHALNYQDTKYEMSIVSEAYKTMLNMKQAEDEHVSDYTRWFKMAREVLESHLGGELLIPKITTKMSGLDINDKAKCDELTRQTAEAFFAYLYLENADQGRFGSILKGLHAQKALQNEQYLKTVSVAVQVLSNHKWDNYKSKKDKNNDKTSVNSSNKEKSGS